MADAAPTRTVDRRDDLAERDEARRESRCDEWERSVERRLLPVAAFRKLLLECPAVSHRWLHGLFAANDPLCRGVLHKLDQYGFESAVLAYLALPSDRRASAAFPLPQAVAWEAVRLALATFRPDGDEAERECLDAAFAAAQWCAPTPADAERILAGHMAEPGPVGFRAAVELAAVAPHTPGLLDRLLEAMATRWGLTQELPTWVNPTAEAILALPAAVLQPPPEPAAVRRAVVWAASGSEWQALEVWKLFGGRVEDFPPPERVAERGDWQFHFWLDLPPEVEARPRALALLLADAEVARYALDRVGPNPLAEVLAADLPAERALPAVAAALSSVHEQDREVVEGLFAAHLARLPDRRDGWSDGDAWLAALCGRSFGQFAWAVYADWVEEQGQADVAEQIRALHAAPIDPADSWGEVYRFISACTQPSGEV